MEQEKICRILLQKIASGELTPGERIASEFELSEQYGVSRMKAHRALALLRQAGILASAPRRGTVIARNLQLPRLKAVRSFFLRKAAILHASPADTIHWGMNTVEKLQHELEQKGFEVSCFPYETGVSKKDSLLPEVFSGISENEYGSIILLPSHWQQIRDNEALFGSRFFRYFLLNYSGIPSRFRLPRMNQVTYDHYNDGFLMGDMLGRSGHRDFIMLASFTGMTWSNERYDGLCDGLRQYMPDCEILSVPSSFDGIGTVEKFICTHGESAVVICANCDYAVSAENILARKDLICGKDYKLVTFADNPLYEAQGFTALEFPVEEAASELAALVTESQCRPEISGQKTVMLLSRFKIRRSFVPEHQ